MPLDDSGYKYVERVVFRRNRNFEEFSGPNRRAVERYVLQETGRSTDDLGRIGYKWSAETLGVPPGQHRLANRCRTLVGKYYWDGVEYDFDALKKAVDRGVGEMLSGKKLSGPPPRMQLVDKRRRA